MTLSDVPQPTLELICEPCGRRGRYNVAKLGDLAAKLANRPKAQTFNIYDRCKVLWGRWE